MEGHIMRQLTQILSVFFAIALGFPLTARSHGGDTTKIHSCVNSDSGAVKIVGASDVCRNNETALDWAVTPIGPPQPLCPPDSVQSATVFHVHATDTPLSSGGSLGFRGVR
jgi:hypothetical protein